MTSGKDDMPRLTAYELWPEHGLALVPAPPARDWMAATIQRNATRCLPMMMANQNGWWLLNNYPVRMMWHGGRHKHAIKIQYHPDIAPYAATGANKGMPAYPTSDFGEGVVTWRMPFVFRTAPGYNLLVRGPANLAKDGIAPLEGLVETDWAPMTFTVNWRFTRPDVWVTFDAGEPIAMLVPQRRGELETFAPEVTPISDDPEVHDLWWAWNKARNWFNATPSDDPQQYRENARETGQNSYTRGELPDGSTAPEHQTRMKLKKFNVNR